MVSYRNSCITLSSVYSYRFFVTSTLHLEHLSWTRLIWAPQSQEKPSIGQVRAVQVPPSCSQLSNSLSGDELSWKKRISGPCLSVLRPVTATLFCYWKNLWSQHFLKSNKTHISCPESKCSQSLCCPCVNLERASFCSLTNGL